MVYIFVLIFCVAYFFSVQGYKINFLVLIPPFLIYFLVSALQYNVGSDYPSYTYIYNNQWVLERYFNTREYFFYYSNIILSYFKAPSQSIFFVFSFVQSLFIFIYLVILKRRGYSLWLFFLIFFTVTNIYNNQLNGIRQYASLTLLPILTILLFERKYIYFLLGCFIATTFHSSSIIFFALFTFIFLQKSLSKYNFLIFIVTMPIYLFVAKYTPLLLEMLDLKYASYIESEYFEAGNYLNVITKLYYSPAILLFFYIFRKKKYTFIKDEGYFSFVIFIFSCTYWSFLMSMDIAILSRLSSYFWFFIIFPLYYVAIYFIRNGYKWAFIFYIIYIASPYIAKVTILAKNEFIYRSYIFN